MGVLLRKGRFSGSPVKKSFPKTFKGSRNPPDHIPYRFILKYLGQKHGEKVSYFIKTPGVFITIMFIDNSSDLSIRTRSKFWVIKGMLDFLISIESLNMY
jgi:hypothetical protein